MSLDEAAISSAAFKHSLWVLYVDETFIIWTNRQEELRQFHLTTKQPTPKHSISH